MAWGSHAERRKAVLKRAEKAEAKAVEHRARADSYRAQGKAEPAKKHAATAARQELIAKTHRQELVRLDLRAQQQASQAVSAAQRAHEMAKAEERASAAAAARPAIDALQAYREALTTAAGLEEDAKRFEKNARGYSRVGDLKRAEMAFGRTDTTRKHAAEWRAEAERIQAGTSRDLARELALALKAQRRLESRDKNETQRLARLGVVGDPRTAAGQREIASGGSGRGKAVASVRSYAELIRRPQDRTRARLETMEAFDNLCGTADAGLFPEPKFEHESGSGQGPGALVMDRRAAGLAQMEAATRAIGAQNVAMLRAWIYERQTLTALARAGYGTEKTAGRLALSAVDALAVHFSRQGVVQGPTPRAGSRSPSAASAAA